MIHRHGRGAGPNAHVQADVGIVAKNGVGDRAPARAADLNTIGIVRRGDAVQRWRPVFAAAAVATALAVFIFARGGDVTAPTAQIPRTVASNPSTTAENVILAMATEPTGEQEVELPEEYLAIEDVVLGE